MIKNLPPPPYIDPCQLSIFLKDHLDWLELSDNGSVTVAGISHLRKLQKLKVLRLENLPGVNDRKGLLSNLKTAMPNCEITFDELKSSEMA